MGSGKPPNPKNKKKKKKKEPAKGQKHDGVKDRENSAFFFFSSLPHSLLDIPRNLLSPGVVVTLVRQSQAGCGFEDNWLLPISSHHGIPLFFFFFFGGGGEWEKRGGGGVFCFSQECDDFTSPMQVAGCDGPLRMGIFKNRRRRGKCKGKASYGFEVPVLSKMCWWFHCASRQKWVL